MFFRAPNKHCPSLMKLERSSCAGVCARPAATRELDVQDAGDTPDVPQRPFLALHLDLEAVSKISFGQASCQVHED